MRRKPLRTAVLPLLLLGLLVGCTVPAQVSSDLGEPIQWVDSAMEQAVRQELDKPTGII